MHTYLFLLAAWLLALPTRAQPTVAPAFTVVPLGVKGGLAEGNLSAYLVAAAGTTAFIALDAGSLRPGAEKAVANHVFTASVDEVLRQNIKGYCLSHPHLDHVAGLLLNAPDDTPKPIYGLPTCLHTLQQDYLNWRAWPNFGNGGAPPALGKYQLRALVPGQAMPLDNTALSVQAFVLSHGSNMQSTAFLVRSHDSYLLYLGDTGADDLEKTHYLHDLWLAVQPLVQHGQLKAIFMEASYPNAQPEQQLFGHLTPALLLRELGTLGQLAGPSTLRGLPVVITHLKPTVGNEAIIKTQLAAGNTLGVKLVFPEQGRALAF
ncbi:3',5'-cyclic-nucleotide phosphodiesterase [Hymenobacter sp. HMF4947]|uniref:3',5'-cyclic-nucleotide phosphodiesterase n=1 Tax=Hymenobacter ginkgonis TaxID=2682976 RepID=A0A7K1TKS7_9BACT|nr:3',5'-cyclic-nucleotide phosphodiesterase [Hymenobacter ginkgonis]MVN79017.1 3',5'-cyclic-nucleotide phosphodiesterase [Hymenobacter ginkgonis]